jgi:aryl-alcohol dehydrogenase-like predicted oxidoreductase
MEFVLNYEEGGESCVLHGDKASEQFLSEIIGASAWERNLEPDIIPVLRELGIGLVPFCPLGRGFLTGEVKRAEEYPEGDFRRTATGTSAIGRSF